MSEQKTPALQTARRLFHVVRAERTFVAMLVLGVASIALNVLGPLLLGRATDLIVGGAIGRRFPAGWTTDQAAAQLRAEGHDSLAALLQHTGAQPGEGIDLGAIGTIVLIALLIYAVSGTCWIVQGRVATTAIQRSAHRLRNDVEAKLGRLPIAYYDQHQRGALLSRTTNDIDNIAQSLQQTMSQLTNSVLLIVAVVGSMVWLSPLLAAVAVVSIGVVVVITGKVGRRAQKLFGEQWTATGALNAHIDEIYGGHDVVTAFDRRAEATAEFDEHNRTVVAAGARAQLLSGTVQPLMNFLNNLGYVVIAVVGCLRVLSGAISIGDLQAFILYSRQLSGPLTQVTSLLGVVQSGLASAQLVFQLLDADDESARGNSSRAAAGTGGARVRFESVSFRYAADRPLIEDLSLTAEPGTTIAIVGNTGAGKTTLMNLLLGFYDLTGGRITVDGRDIADMPRSELRAGIGVVLQDPWLFTGTISENIGYGQVGADQAKVEAAARAAHADHFVRTLPDGYQTVIDAQDDGLSAGERQLIAIARAFVTDPRILVLDEATSAVDSRTELLIRRGMDKLRRGRTTFVVAHRLSTIREADSILVMQDGAIVAQGTHQQLIATDDVYRRLYKAQFAPPVLDGRTT